MAFILGAWLSALLLLFIACIVYEIHQDAVVGSSLKWSKYGAWFLTIFFSTLILLHLFKE